MLTVPSHIGSFSSFSILSTPFTGMWQRTGIFLYSTQMREITQSTLMDYAETYGSGLEGFITGSFSLTSYYDAHGALN
jgi:hypothetical protein